MPFLWISLGAVFGANARYLVNRLMAQWLGTAFPYGTFVVNIFLSVFAGLAGVQLGILLTPKLGGLL